MDCDIFGSYTSPIFYPFNYCYLIFVNFFFIGLLRGELIGRISVTSSNSGVIFELNDGENETTIFRGLHLEIEFTLFCIA